MSVSAVRPADTVGEGYVPVISWAGVDDPRHRPEIARQMGEALRRSGFYVLVDHDVPRVLFDDLCAAAEAWFAEPVEAKQRYAPDPADLSRRGWSTRLRPSRGIGIDGAADAVEAWTCNPFDPNLGWRDLARLDPRTRAELAFPNRFPPGFSGALAYLAAMEQLALRRLALYELDLDLPPGYFARLCAQPLTNLAVNYYPPAASWEPATDAFTSAAPSCLSEHTDLGIETGLMDSGKPGLQVVDREHPDHWVPVPAVPGGIVVNAGDALVRISGGRYCSSYHRVVCLTNEVRISIPVFVQPGPMETLEPALPPVDGTDPADAAPINFWDFFKIRMGLMHEAPRG